MSEEQRLFYVSEANLGMLYGCSLSKQEIVALTRLQSSPYKVTYCGVSLPNILEHINSKYDRWGVRRAG